MKTIDLAGKQVGRVGYVSFSRSIDPSFGLMLLTWVPEPVPDEVAFAAMKAAVDAGATAWCTATFYGNPVGEDGGYNNLRLIGRFFKKYPEYIGKVQLVTKGSMGPGWAISGEYEFNKAIMEKAKECLGEGVEIDVYLPTRVIGDPVEFFAPLERLRKEGYFGALGASEVSAPTLRKLQEHYKIVVAEIEVSLWSYAKEIKEVIEWSKENEVPVYCYAPLGRGFLTRTYSKPEEIPAGQIQSFLPRFQGDAFYNNLKIVDAVEEFAKEKGWSNAQVAIAWVLGLSDYVSEGWVLS